MTLGFKGLTDGNYDDWVKSLAQTLPVPFLVDCCGFIVRNRF